MSYRIVNHPISWGDDALDDMLGRHIKIFSADSENGHFTYTDNARVFAVHKDSGEILVKIFLWQRLRIRASQPHRLWINLGDKIGGVVHQK